MSCGICQSYSFKYCSCGTINVDDGKPIIHSGRRPDEFKIRLDKFNSFLVTLEEELPNDTSIGKIKEYIKSINQFQPEKEGF